MGRHAGMFSFKLASIWIFLSFIAKNWANMKKIWLDRIIWMENVFLYNEVFLLIYEMKSDVPNAIRK